MLQSQTRQTTNTIYISKTSKIQALQFNTEHGESRVGLLLKWLHLFQ